MATRKLYHEDDFIIVDAGSEKDRALRGIFEIGEKRGGFGQFCLRQVAIAAHIELVIELNEKLRRATAKLLAGQFVRVKPGLDDYLQDFLHFGGKGQRWPHWMFIAFSVCIYPYNR